MVEGVFELVSPQARMKRMLGEEGDSLNRESLEGWGELVECALEMRRDFNADAGRSWHELGNAERERH